jgi:2-(1,2-epoxy-1,2-dihydrophenyl)acetyl-CoA isomerase
MTQDVKVTDDGGVRWITIDRPESRNGLTLEINGAMIEALEGVAKDESVRVVVLSGAGGSFSSGLDLKDAMRRGPMTPEATEERMRSHFHGLIRAIRAVPVPTIAAVDGAAAGFGCDLALACDLRLLSDRAKFGEIFVKRGLMPDGGGTFHLPRLVGLGRALELLFTGDVIDAEEAFRIGLGNRVIPAADFEAEVRAFAARLAAGPPLVYRAVKEAVYASLDGDLDGALERELRGQVRLLQSTDFIEGVTAFLQKRAPTFRGR